MGAAKIAILSGTGISAPTAARILKEAGYPPINKYHPRHTKRICKAAGNDQWNIDFVEIGIDRLTGRKVESLSVEDDHSRYSFSSYVTTNATTDFVIDSLEELFETYGKPRIIRSDHGCQWYSTVGGECRFDVWCESMGIIHTMAAIRVPQENGKVERYHGSIRRELPLPEEATVEEYRDCLDDYRDFYNNERPHYSLDYRTPERVYNKTAYIC